MRNNVSAINVLSLAAIQGANALFPLLVFPYLLVVLGKDEFASLVVAEAIAFYMLTVCLYSFDTAGVQLIVDARLDSSGGAESKCFVNILAARVLLFIVATLACVGLLSIFSTIDLVMVVVWAMFAFGTVLQSNYYFQAIESNFVLASFVIVSRFTAVICVYLLVKGEDDALLASVILAGSYMVSGFSSLVFLSRRFRFSVVELISVSEVVELIWKGRHIFIGNLSVALFRGANVLILAWVSTSTAVSIYALAEKVIKSVQALTRPLNQLQTPKVFRGWAGLPEEYKSHLNAFRLIWKYSRIQIILMAIVLPLMVAFAHVLSAMGMLPGFESDVVVLISWMSPAVIFGVANSMFGSVGLSVIGRQSYFAKSVLVVGGGAFIISLLFSSIWGASGAGVAFVMAEILLLLAFIAGYRAG